MERSDIADMALLGFLAACTSYKCTLLVQGVSLAFCSCSSVSRCYARMPAMPADTGAYLAGLELARAVWPISL